jgi:hypothetical protein
LFIIFSIIDVFAVIIPLIILGDLSISFGLEIINIGKTLLVVYFLLISLERIFGIDELYRELDNFLFKPI